ncbi:CBS domain-containing protein [Nocardia africana]|uniref:CBS domain-containing protein n=1 Tax=Nocardia africana TaxID=134964 RepID=UPI000A03CDF6|nr:CBS domain-containing protein [Nocardia africana]MCC3314106.1 CBS domain-containing protein [Nocardia africana]
MSSRPPTDPSSPAAAPRSPASAPARVPPTRTYSQQHRRRLDARDVLEKLEDHQIKRLPVIENKRLVGMISEADIARHPHDEEIAEYVERVSARG